MENTRCRPDPLSRTRLRESGATESSSSSSCCLRRRTAASAPAGKGAMLVLYAVLLVALLSAEFVAAGRKANKSYKSIQEMGRKYLAYFGYVTGPNQETENLMSEDVLKTAIKRLQQLGGIPATGTLDHRTIELMERKRCGNKDFPNDLNSRKKRYVHAPSRWPNGNLTFRILNYTPDLALQETREAIYEALKVWSDVTDLSFTEVMFSGESDADIRIQFASGYHKDGYPFDGKGVVLAHAFFPGADKGGDTHFDDDELWKSSNHEEGVDLFMAAAHEFGHALGLSHSKDENALMYPWYQGNRPKHFKLPQDDVNGIQALYGKKTVKTPKIPTQKTVPPTRATQKPLPPMTPSGKPLPCQTRFDAITKIRGDVYIFKDKYFWRWDSGTLKDYEPTEISRFWYGFPENSTDAVYERATDGKIVFFKGDKYWMYNGNYMISGFQKEGRPITEFGIPSTVKKIDAVYIWGYNQRTYLISNDMYWKFDVKDSQVEYDYPRDMMTWLGVPVPVDAAFQYSDGKTYFMKGKYYWEFYDDKMQVKTKEPTGLISKKWMQCHDANKQPYTINENQKQDLASLGKELVAHPVLLIFMFLASSFSLLL